MTRSKYFKRKHVRRVFFLWINKWVFNTTVAVILAATVLLTYRAFNPPTPFYADMDSLAAFRVPALAMSNLYSLSNWYDIPFDQMLAMYAINNDFFPIDSQPTVEISELQSQYVADFNRLRRKYSNTGPYFLLFNNLISDLEHFPIPPGYEYMFSDTWDSPRGTNILDLENVKGRIPILSMTAGQVSQAGWHYQAGYHVMIVTESGGRVLYAHLDSLQGDIAQGARVSPGQSLGAMGASGATGRVSLHIAISPAFKEDFWINPYPFLRHMEEKMYIFPLAVYTN